MSLARHWSLLHSCAYISLTISYIHVVEIFSTHQSVEEKFSGALFIHSPVRGLCELHMGWGLLEPLIHSQNSDARDLT